jgi:hypothetical protein
VPLSHNGSSFCRLRPTPSAVHSFLRPNFPEDISIVQYHCCTTGHFPAGGSQLISGFTISSGQLPVFVSTRPLPGNALIKSVIIFIRAILKNSPLEKM